MRMMEDKKKGSFRFGINLFEDEGTGEITWETMANSENIPQELVLMVMRVFLNNKEQDFFDAYRAGTANYKEDN
jgi:hypothetical protein